jgi:sulfate adenylyltransferase
VDDPYEEPVNPEITLTTVDSSPEENARKIVSYLEERGFLLPDGNGNKAAEASEQETAVVA